jgi:hypothetical protein
MKQRKNLYLSREAIARGQQLALETGKTLSAIVEAQLLAVPSMVSQPDDYWPGPHLRPLARPGDPRSNYLKLKHGA